MGAPKTITLEDDNKVITGTIEGLRVYFTSLEAIDLINELSGVLLAYERNKQHS